MESSDLIRPAGRWIIETAIEAVALFPAHLTMSINLSASQLSDPGLVASFERALAKHAIDPARIEVELTESTIMDQSPRSIVILKSLREIGVKFALDDFGTGYSSLSMLTIFHFDRIKIDRNFVMNLDDRMSAILLSQIVDLAQKMGSSVTVEGIETLEQADFIGQFKGIDVQGYLYGRPVSLPKAIDVALDNNADRTNVVRFGG
jgi:EAL domain-containing protein (putative c-di-GMP-specific phosphodiesterase class I)